MAKAIMKVGAVVRSATQIIPSASYIVIENGLISEVGEGIYKGDISDATVIDRSNRVAIPGLVNSHGHAAMTLLRGAGDDMPLMNWLNDRIFPLEAKLTEEAIYWGTQLACWEMIQSGTTCFTDMYFFMHNTAKAVSEVGMRAVLSWGIVGFNEDVKKAGISNSRSFVAQWNGTSDGRITTTLGPHAPYTCPPDYLTEVAKLSAELNVPIQIHLSETMVEVENSKKEFGKTPIAHALDCGLLNRPVLAAHCVHVTDEDIQIMQQHDVRVAHNPQSNLKLASGVAPVVKMKQAGLIVGLGTDGAASNNNLDMFEEMRLAATLHKGVLFDATAIPAAAAFQMATEDSAKAVFLSPGHGTLSVGAPADITLLDLTSSHFHPSFDLLSNIVYAAGADDVTDVFVNGNALLSNKSLTTIDTERVSFEFKRIEASLRQG